MTRLPRPSSIQIRNAIGLTSLALVVAGIWGLTNWHWAAIATGIPAGAFYLWGEVRAVRSAPPLYDEGDG